METALSPTYSPILELVTRINLSQRGGARYRVRTCDPYHVKVMLYH